MPQQSEQELAEELADHLDVAFDALIDAEAVATDLVEEGDASEEILDLAVNGQWEVEAALDALREEYSL